MGVEDCVIFLVSCSCSHGQEKGKGMSQLSSRRSQLLCSRMTPFPREQFPVNRRNISVRSDEAEAQRKEKEKDQQAMRKEERA